METEGETTTSTALVENPAPNTPAHPVSFSMEMTAEDIQLVRDTYAKDCSDAEFRLFINVAQQRGLSPLNRQIHAVKRGANSPMTIQTSIDGFRLIAQRTGRYQGQTKMLWADVNGKWYEFWPYDTPPVAAQVGVHHADFVEPLYGTAMFREYAQKKQNGELNSMWAGMPANQLAKCAEALAFRKAFPEELSGVYTDDEMGQADNPVIETQTSPNAPQQSNQGASYAKHQMEVKKAIDALQGPARKEFADWYKSKNFKKVTQLSPGAAKAVLKEIANINKATEDPERPFDDEPTKPADKETGEIIEATVVEDETALMNETAQEEASTSGLWDDGTDYDGQAPAYPDQRDDYNH